MENKLTSYRTLLLINGIIAILFGIFALFVPQSTAKAVAVYFGIVLIIGGLVGLYYSINSMKNEKPYLLNLLSSVVSTLVGIFIVIYTQRSLEIFAVIIGIWAIIIGVLQLIISLSLSKSSTHKKMLIINSIVTLIFGLILFFNPFESVVAIVFLIGVLAIIFGSVLIYLSLVIRKFEDDITRIH
jgi:uncharacterized membrane protein HdeD (DUF308 family)